MCGNFDITNIDVPAGVGASQLEPQLRRWVKVSSERIVHDTEVCGGITIICGRFITIYGD